MVTAAGSRKRLQRVGSLQGEQGADVGVGECLREKRREEHHHHVIAHRRHRRGHALDDVAMASKRAGDHAVRRSRAATCRQQQRDQRLHQRRPGTGERAVRGAEGRRGRHAWPTKPRRSARAPSPARPTGRDARGVVRVGADGIRPRSPSTSMPRRPRLDDPLQHPPGHGHDHDRGCEDEPVVAERVDRVGRAQECARRSPRSPPESRRGRTGRSWRTWRRSSARIPRRSRRADAVPRRKNNAPPERKDDDRRRVGQQVTRNRGDDDQRCQQPRRRDRQHSAQRPGNEPRSFRHAHANHHHQHHAQRREGDERLDHA